MRATGGVFFVTALSGGGRGCNIDTSGNLSCTGTISGTSDRNAKRDFSSVDPDELLKKLAAVPIGSWSYKAENKSVRHIGPMAQDFHSAFRVGADDKHIAMVDADGVALAAIQGLYRLNSEKDREIRELQLKNAQMSRQLDELGTIKARLDSLERQSGLIRTHAE